MPRVWALRGSMKAQAPLGRAASRGSEAAERVAPRQDRTLPRAQVLFPSPAGL